MPIGQLTDQEIKQRCESLLRACHQRGNHIDVPHELVRAFKECSQESARRGISNTLDLGQILRRNDPAPVVHPGSIVRYLREPHLTEFANGVISFAPATSYAQEADPARRDDEHARAYMVPDQVLEFSGVEYPTTEIRMRRTIAGDDGRLFPYHLVSFSAEESHKLRRSFTADGAVVISEPKAFVDLLWKKLRVDQPNCSIQLRRIKYYDPMAKFPDTKGSDILFLKSIEFAWQREARIVILDGLPENQRIHLTISPPQGLMRVVRFG